jgi:hypothetical protein
VGEPSGVRRVLPVALVVVAGLADATSAPRLAFYALVAAVPAAALAALDAYGDMVDVEAPDAIVRAQAALWGVTVALLVIGTAPRAPTLGAGSVPRFASTALLACLVVFLAQAATAAVAFFRETARPAVDLER